MGQATMIQKSLLTTDEQIRTLTIAEREVSSKIVVIEQSVMALHNKTKKVREDILQYAGEASTIEKASANMLKQSKLNYADVNKKEVEIEDLTNEVARVKIDNLNTKQQNDLLNNKVNELNAERNLKEIEVTEQERMAKKA